jgi:hypothetical protein
MFKLSRPTARLLVIVPFAALLAAACEHNEGPPDFVAGQLMTIIVTPNPGSAVVGGTIQYTATGRDVTNVAVTISPAPTWTVVAGGGTIPPGPGVSAVFTAGATPGTYTNTIRATSGSISGFATAIVTAFASPISLGAAATHGILAGSAITCADGATPYSTIYADVSLSPGTLSSITGFPPCVITGLRSADDSPNPTYASNAQAALLTAYNQAGAMTCDSTIAALPSGTTLAPGVYCSGSTIIQTGTLTLNGGGDQNATFVFKAGSSLTTAGSVILSGGTQAKNVYWWNGASATLGVGSAWQGTILAQSSITLAGTVTLCGRALARTGAVALDGDNDIIKLPPAAPPTCTFP